MIMTPALGFFYGGLVRRKNLVSRIAQCFAIFAVVSLVWALWGYTLALGPSYNGFIGSFSNFGLNNVGAAPNPGFFFFQAEDGIRDLIVTGVQTCALPISSPTSTSPASASRRR